MEKKNRNLANETQGQETPGGLDSSIGNWEKWHQHPGVLGLQLCILITSFHLKPELQV